MKNKDYVIIVTSSKYSYNFLCKVIEKKKVIFLNSTLNQNPKNIFLWIKELLIIFYLRILFYNSSPKKVFFYAPIYDLIGCFIVTNIFKNSEIILSNPIFNEGINGYKKVPENSLLHNLYSKFYGMPVHSYDNYRLEIFGGGHIPGLPKDFLPFNQAEYWDVRDAIHAGPVLITNGMIDVTVEEEVFSEDFSIDLDIL